MTEETAKIIEKMVKETSNVNALAEAYKKETGLIMGTTFEEVTRIKEVESKKKD